METPEDLDRLAEDWIALWQSEIAGLAADPELAEQWAAWAALGAAWMRAATAMAPPMSAAPPHDRARCAAGAPARCRCTWSWAPAGAMAGLGLPPTQPRHGRPAGRAGTPAGRSRRRARRSGPDPRRPRRRAATRLTRCRAVVARLLRADRALIAGMAGYRRHPFSRIAARPARDLGRGRVPAARFRRRGAGGAVRALPGEPRLCAGPGAGTIPDALAARPGLPHPAAGLGLAGRGGAAVHPDRLRGRPAGTRSGRRARAGGAGGLLHGRAAGDRRRAAPAGPGARRWRCSRHPGISMPGRRRARARAPPPPWCRGWRR